MWKTSERERKQGNKASKQQRMKKDFFRSPRSSQISPARLRIMQVIRSDL